MLKSIVSKYLEKSTDIYYLVDENFLSGFEEKQGAFMLMKYYEVYTLYYTGTSE